MSSRRRTGIRASTQATALALLIAFLLPGGSTAASSHANAARARAAVAVPSAWDVPGEPYLAPKQVAALWVEQAGGAQAAPGVPAAPPRHTVLGVQVADSWPLETTVIVTARQTPGAGSDDVGRVAAVRVELGRDDTGSWVVLRSDDTAPAPVPPDRSAVTGPAQRVLDDDRIVLSEPARSDVLAGRVDDRLLDLLTTLASCQRLEVSLLSGGYRSSRDVSGTQHASGRAADVRRVDGEPVSSEHVEGTFGLMRAARARGADASGPILLDGDTSPLIPDHIHLGVR